MIVIVTIHNLTLKLLGISTQFDNIVCVSYSPTISRCSSLTSGTSKLNRPPQTITHSL